MDPSEIAAIEHLFAKLSARDRLEQFERTILCESPKEVRSYDARRRVVRGGTQLKESLLLLEGVIARAHDLPDGGRAILELHVPGDFVDLQGFLLKRLEHDLIALSPVKVACVPHERLKEVSERWPHLTRLLWFTSLMDAAVHRAWLVSNSRRPALARIAHLFCELRVRLEVAGLADPDGYALPITQIDVADATGLTPIHVNRMLKTLRTDGVMTFRDGRVTIHDLARLERVGEFNPDYLFLENQPR